MKIDDLTLIYGGEIEVAPGVIVRQPRLRDICSRDVGEQKYNLYVSVFDMTLSDLIGESNIIPQEFIEHMHIFDVMIGFDDYRKILTEAFRFFTDCEIIYDAEQHCFVTDAGGRITREVFDDLAPLILKFNCIKPRRDTAKKFSGKRAKAIFDKIQKAKAAQQKHRGNADPNYTIANMVSKLSSKHPSYNLLNIWDLTIYQLYDQFSCTCMNNQLDVIGLRWAAWGKEDFDFTQWYKKQS